MRIKTRIEKLERALMIREPQLIILPVRFGSSPEESKSAYCEERGLSPGEADCFWIFVRKFADPSQPVLLEKPVGDVDAEIHGLLAELEAEGLTRREIEAALQGETPVVPASDPTPSVEPSELSPECVEELRRLNEGFYCGTRDADLPTFAPRKAEDLTKLFTKKRGLAH